MAMPRPSGKAQRIAEKVIPGLHNQRARKGGVKKKPSQDLSKVEIMQTRNIESKEGLR